MRRKRNIGRDLLKGGESLPVKRYRQRLFTALDLKTEKSVGKRRRALDLGCGEGLESVSLAEAGYQVHGIDLKSHPQWKRVTREFKGRVKFSTAEVEKLKDTTKYDLVFAKDMLHHVADPVKALRSMKRLTKPGGKVIVVECNRLNPVFYVHLTLMGNHQHFSRWRLKKIFVSAGMADFKLKLREARVWPWAVVWFQNSIEFIQDLIEKIPFFRPFVCYHLVTWHKTGKKK